MSEFEPTPDRNEPEGTALPARGRSEIDAASLPAFKSAGHPALGGADVCARALLDGFVEWEPQTLNELRGAIDGVLFTRTGSVDERRIVLEGFARAVHVLAELDGTVDQMLGMYTAFRQVLEAISDDPDEIAPALQTGYDTLVKLLDPVSDISLMNPSLKDHGVRSELYCAVRRLSELGAMPGAAGEDLIAIACAEIKQLHQTVKHEGEEFISSDTCELVDAIAGFAERTACPLFSQPMASFFIMLDEQFGLEYIVTDDETDFSDSLELSWQDGDAGEFGADGTDFHDADPDEEYGDEDLWAQQHDDATDVETAAHVIGTSILRSLVYCQSGAELRDMWTAILTNLEVSDVGWTTALAGMSKIEPEYVRPIVKQLLAEAAEWERPSEENEQESALPLEFIALIELASANRDSLHLYEMVLSGFSEQQRLSLQQVCREAYLDGEIDLNDMASPLVDDSDLPDLLLKVFGADIDTESFE